MTFSFSHRQHVIRRLRDQTLRARTHVGQTRKMKGRAKEGATVDDFSVPSSTNSERQPFYGERRSMEAPTTSRRS